MPKDKIEGYLEVGTNEHNEVIINLPEDKTGHLVFSPNQALDLAGLLLKHALIAHDAMTTVEGNCPCSLPKESP